MAEAKIGHITHYFGHVGVGAIQLTDGDLAIGDTIHVKGHTSDFTQVVESMQIEHANVTKAACGQNVGTKLKEHARVKDTVFKVVPG
ncbi:MAG: translation elongation factor-like protein [Lentisphaerae bacterium]|nr:translation elongation factor-like protein [Lentisphaerota bacterium]